MDSGNPPGVHLESRWNLWLRVKSSVIACFVKGGLCPWPRNCVPEFFLLYPWSTQMAYAKEHIRHVQELWKASHVLLRACLATDTMYHMLVHSQKSQMRNCLFRFYVTVALTGLQNTQILLPIVQGG
jgi:hypothetical protein